MNSKKIISCLSTCLVAVGLFSNLAFAAAREYPSNEIKYGFKLPTTGYCESDSIHKSTKSDQNAYNKSTYIGWEGTDINSWVVNMDGDQLSSEASYSTTGNYKMWYDVDFAKDYYGHPVRLKIKTSLHTYHPCNTNGLFKD